MIGRLLSLSSHGVNAGYHYSYMKSNQLPFQRIPVTQFIVACNNLFECIFLYLDAHICIAYLEWDVIRSIYILMWEPICKIQYIFTIFTQFLGTFQPVYEACHQIYDAWYATVKSSRMKMVHIVIVTSFRSTYSFEKKHTHNISPCTYRVAMLI